MYNHAIIDSIPEKAIEKFEIDFVLCYQRQPEREELVKHIKEAMHLDVAHEILGKALFRKCQPILCSLFTAEKK